MPRVTSLRIGALSDLARQLRYAPRRTLVRQLRNVESLAAEIDPDAVYSEAWLVERITGYRPDLPNPATLVGEALRGDLSAFAEAVSDAAGLAASDLDAGGMMSLPELCARWGVSRKTIERWRRRGLVAYRVRESAGQVRLAFRRQRVEWFEQRRGAEISRAQKHRRVSPDRTAALIETARRLRRRFGWSLNRTARRLAERSGLAHETVRRMLHRHDASATEPIFSEAGPLDERAARVIHRAMRRGVAPRLLSERYGRTPTSIRRIALQERAALLRSLPAPKPASSPAVAKEAEAALRSPVATMDLLLAPDRTLADFLKAAGGAAPPARAEERALGLAAAALRRRAAETAAGLSRHHPKAAAVDEAECGLRWAAQLQGKLAATHRRWALSTLENWINRPLGELPPGEIRRLHAMAMDALLAAAMTFDAGAGGRLAAPAGVVLNRALAKWSAAGGGESVRASGARARPASVALTDWTRRIAPWQAWLAPDPRLVRLAPRLEEPARTIVTARYGLDGAPPRTVESIAQEFGLSTARVTILEREALRRARREAASAAGGPTVG